MKRCPSCGQTYESSINFCLNDGELLVFGDGTPKSLFDPEPPNNSGDDAPPTLMMDQSRVTNQNWPIGGPMTSYQNNTPNVMYSPPQFGASTDKTLPTIALVLGIASLIMICCYGGIWLGIPAAIVGFIGLNNINRDPTRYAGKEMAIAGMVMGIVSFILVFLFIFIALIAN